MGINYNYIKIDSDITIVFLHGWGLSGKSFNKIISNIENVSMLQVDLPGFGKSDNPKEYFDTYEYSYQIFLLLKRLGINKIVFVGHSFGGRLSILLSSVFGLDIVGCVLTSSAGLNRFGLVKWIKIKKYKLIKKMVDKKILNSKMLQSYGSVDYKNANSVLQKVLVRVVNQDLKNYTKLINVRTLLVWDKKDEVTPYWICRKMHRNICNSKIVVLNKGGHFVAFYNAVKFSNLLKSFICLLINGTN